MCWDPVSSTTRFIVESDLSESNRRIVDYWRSALLECPEIGEYRSFYPDRIHISVCSPLNHPASRTSLQYLVNGGELCPDGPGMESGAVPEPPRRPLPAAVEHPAGRLLPVQRSGRRLVSSELGAALPVAMRGAGLPVQTVMAAGARGQTLGDVLRVGGGTSLTGTPVENTQQRTASHRVAIFKKQEAGFHIFTADGTVGLKPKLHRVVFQFEPTLDNKCVS